MNLPNFFIAGMPRCGTTFARRVLNQHPDVYMAHGEAVKQHCGRKSVELWYFNKDQNYEKGLSWYAKCFEGANGEKYIGEKTPWYVRPPAPERISKDLGPDVKFLVLFRNPMSRAWSHWVHCQDRPYGARHKGKTFGECIRHRDHSYPFLEASSYGHYLKCLLEFHDRGNIHVMISEELKANPYAECSKMFDWMGLRAPAPEKLNLQAKVNRSNYDKYGDLPEEDESFLRDSLKYDTEEFYGLIGREVKAWK